MPRKQAANELIIKYSRLPKQIEILKSFNSRMRTMQYQKNLPEKIVISRLVPPQSGLYRTIVKKEKQCRNYAKSSRIRVWLKNALGDESVSWLYSCKERTLKRVAAHSEHEFMMR
jgi:hypothetical protein